MMQEPHENRVDQLKYYVEKWHKAEKGSRIVWRAKCQALYHDMARHEIILLGEMAKIYSVDEAKLVLGLGVAEPALSAFTARIAELKML